MGHQRKLGTKSFAIRIAPEVNNGHNLLSMSVHQDVNFSYIVQVDFHSHNRIIISSSLHASNPTSAPEGLPPRADLDGMGHAWGGGEGCVFQTMSVPLVKGGS